jgi:hypothetical protein
MLIYFQAPKIVIYCENKHLNAHGSEYLVFINVLANAYL